MKKLSKMLVVVLIVILAMPLTVFGTVAELAYDTTTPGYSLAGKAPAQKDIEFQLSLTEDKEFQLEIPTDIDKDELAAAVQDEKIELSLERDEKRIYMDPSKFPHQFKGGTISKWVDNRKDGAEPILKVKSIEVKDFNPGVPIKAGREKSGGEGEKSEEGSDDEDSDPPPAAIEEAQTENAGPAESMQPEEKAEPTERSAERAEELEEEKEDPKYESNGESIEEPRAELGNAGEGDVNTGSEDEKALAAEDEKSDSKREQPLPAKAGEKGTLLIELESSCYFYKYDYGLKKYVKDYSVPHTVGGPYMDLCGYFDLKVKADGQDVASLHSKVVPYDKFRSVYELYDEFESIKKYSGDVHAEVRSFGHTTNGYDQQYVIISDSKESVDRWLDYTDKSEDNPTQVIKDLKAGKYDDLRVPIFIGNCHSNEVSAVSGPMEFIQLMLSDQNEISINEVTGYTDAGRERLEHEKNDIFKRSLSQIYKGVATEIGRVRGENGIGKDRWGNDVGVSAPIDMEAYYNVEEDTIKKQELLKHVFFIVVPTMNLEGYESLNRCTGGGHDPNRDEANQTMAETANYMALMNKWNPMVYNEAHGRVEGMLIEPCTPPHEPNFEYDLIAEQFLELAEALGNGCIANNDHYNSFETPARDYLSLDPNSPTGVQWDEPWDDMTTAYGSQFPCLIGTCGITWEIPVYNDIVAERVIPYGVLSEAKYVCKNKIDMLTNQALLFERGVNNMNSNDKVKKYYVDQYDRLSQQGDLMRPIHDGEGENGNFYAEAFIIPMDKANQRNIEDAAAELKYLTRNDVKVNIADKEFTYKNVKYPVGTMVVSMYQAKRSLAHSQLFPGTFINVWKGLFSESFAQRPYARGFDIITVAEPAEYGKIMKAAGKVTDYKTTIGRASDFKSQFSGVEKADVIIRNASNDSAQAVNELLKAGKNVGFITEGEERGNFIVSYEDFLEIADKYSLSAEGVYGKGIKAPLIGKSPTVYVPGAWQPNDVGYVGFSKWVYEYNFDTYALNKTGFKVTRDLSEADAIVGQKELTDEDMNAVKGGIPFMAIGSLSSAQIPNTSVKGLDYGTDWLGIVEYPNDTMVNASYIREGDNIMYQYGTQYFDQIPEGANPIVKNAGKEPLQGCIGLFNEDLKKEFNLYNTGVVAFELQKEGMDIAAFANTLTYKEHQTDEYSFISNFLFSRMMTDENYQGVEQAPAEEEFTITIDPNGGSWDGDAAIKTMKIKKGEYITLPVAPTKDGYTFQYWKGSEYKPGDKYKVVEDHTFTAVWEENASKPGPGEPNTGNEKPNRGDKTTTGSDKPGKANGVNTGDTPDLYIWIAIAAAAFAGTVIVIRKRKNS